MGGRRSAAEVRILEEELAVLGDPLIAVFISKLKSFIFVLLYLHSVSRVNFAHFANLVEHDSLIENFDRRFF